MQTTSSELSKKLKELGLKKEGFGFYKNDETILRFFNRDYSLSNKITEAYTLDEVLAMLPSILTNHEHKFVLLSFNKGSEKYVWFYSGSEGYTDDLIEFIHKNPAEAAGQLLVWCIEQGYVKVEEINNEMA